MLTPNGIYLDYAAAHPLLDCVLGAVAESAYYPSNSKAGHAGGIHFTSKIIELKNRIAKLMEPAFGRQLDHTNVILTNSGSDANLLAKKLYHGKTIAVNVPFNFHDSIQVEDKDRVKLTPELNYFNAAKDECYFHTSVSHLTGRLLPFPDVLGYLHIDHVQGFMKHELLPRCGVTSVSISAHKLGGLPGIGALITTLDNDEKDANVSLAHILGFTKAIDYWDDPSILEALSIVSGFMKMTLCVESHKHKKWRILSNFSGMVNQCIALLAIKRPENAEEGINYATNFLSDNGILVSETSACSSRVANSILEHLGVDPLKEDIVRLSWGLNSNKADIDALITGLNKI